MRKECVIFSKYQDCTVKKSVEFTVEFTVDRVYSDDLTIERGRGNYHGSNFRIYSNFLAVESTAADQGEICCRNDSKILIS